MFDSRVAINEMNIKLIRLDNIYKANRQGVYYSWEVASSRRGACEFLSGGGAC